MNNDGPSAGDIEKTVLDIKLLGPFLTSKNTHLSSLMWLECTWAREPTGMHLGS